jgi:hypothetical protein
MGKTSVVILTDEEPARWRASTGQGTIGAYAPTEPSDCSKPMLWRITRPSLAYHVCVCVHQRAERRDACSN